MRKTLSCVAGALSLTVVATSAFAADLPARGMPPVFFPPPIPVFTWTGFYVGANAGVGFDRRDGFNNTFNIANGQLAGSTGTAGTLVTGGNAGSNTAFTGGGQVGFNYQFSPGPAGGVVAGVEADAQYLGFNAQGGGATPYSFTPNNPLSYGVAFVPVKGLARPTVVLSGQARDDFFGTVRGRLGYAFNRFFAYGTGGFAYSNRNTGYAVGGGLEYAITNNISLRGEYLYVNLRSGSQTFNPVFDITTNTVFLNDVRRGENFSVARAALNYKFDFGAPLAPVVARY